MFSGGGLRCPCAARRVVWSYTDTVHSALLNSTLSLSCMGGTCYISFVDGGTRPLASQTVLLLMTPIHLLSNKVKINR